MIWMLGICIESCLAMRQAVLNLYTDCAVEGRAFALTACGSRIPMRGSRELSFQMRVGACSRVPAHALRFNPERQIDL